MAEPRNNAWLCTSIQGGGLAIRKYASGATQTLRLGALGRRKLPGRFQQQGCVEGAGIWPARQG